MKVGALAKKKRYKIVHSIAILLLAFQILSIVSILKSKITTKKNREIKKIHFGHLFSFFKSVSNLIRADSSAQGEEGL